MKTITLSHGSGGTLMHNLIKDLFIKNLDNPFLNKLGDAALIKSGTEKLAYTTDSFVVKPLFFPGGDIGKLSVCGTVNDLAVSGAMPKYLSCGMIVEDGFSYADLEKITISIRDACKSAGVNIVTGDFKVVEKGAIDGIFINTSGIGEVFKNQEITISRIKPGDKIIISGTIGDHAASILLAREELKFKARILSDCSPLNKLVSSIICKDIKFMRDPTRGGLATTLNEISLVSGYNIAIEEKNIPIKKPVRTLCEILGFDPLYMANEGKLIATVSKDSADSILSKMKKHSLGKDASIIGEVKKEKDEKVYLKTQSGGLRILDMITGEQLPRIC
ncbi:MAG: hydrogenase expression/formation protein HypE [Candidatus Omnitrophica bacterium CG1_02_40_15]|nr:MAG: hydrogenase expression/formation protein HypE [Candidatus Omnitrophica bacterium CG1_02_40_15]